MTLCELIQRFETGHITDADFEHPLARDIVEELAQCRESEVQRALFDDARKLADHIVEQYLRLDREDKLKMAEAYRAEECFKDIAAIKSGTKARLKKLFGKSNFELLSWISNYSKITHILESYVRHIEENKTKVNIKTSTLSHYLRTHDADGNEVKPAGSESLESFYNYDFRNVRRFKKGEWSAQSIVDSLTFGVSDDLRQRVIDAQSLRRLRTRILENYLRFIEENQDDLNMKNSSLTYYLFRHNANGNKVTLGSSESLASFYEYDFRNSGGFKKGKNARSVVDSLTFGVSDDLRQRVIDAQSLRRLRTRILENYLRFIEENQDDLNMKNSSLTHYLLRHNANGEKVKPNNSALNAFYQYDFRNGRSFKKGELDAESVVDSFTFGVSAELRKRVTDTQSLLKLRTCILENYVQHIEENEAQLNMVNSKLTYYLLRHDIGGREVRLQSSKSLNSFYHRDFRSGGNFKKGELNAQSVVDSLTFGVSDDLRQRVIDAQSLRRLRTRILENYVKYIGENEDKISIRSSSLTNYLLTHDADGKDVMNSSIESLLSFYNYDFRNGRTFKNGERNPEAIFASMTHRIKDSALVEKVRRYALAA